MLEELTSRAFPGAAKLRDRAAAPLQAPAKSDGGSTCVDLMGLVTSPRERESETDDTGQLGRFLFSASITTGYRCRAQKSEAPGRGGNSISH